MSILLAFFPTAFLALTIGAFVTWFVRLHDRREARMYCEIFGHNWRNIYGDEINHSGGYRSTCLRCAARSKELQ